MFIDCYQFQGNMYAATVTQETGKNIKVGDILDHIFPHAEWKFQVVEIRPVMVEKVGWFSLLMKEIKG